jgi:hypothetical protein
MGMVARFIALAIYHWTTGSLEGRMARKGRGKIERASGKHGYRIRIVCRRAYGARMLGATIPALPRWAYFWRASGAGVEKARRGGCELCARTNTRQDASRRSEFPQGNPIVTLNARDDDANREIGDPRAANFRARCSAQLVSGPQFCGRLRRELWPAE